MGIKTSVTISLLIGLFISILINVALIIINDRIFLEQLQLQKVEEMLNSGEIQIIKGTNTKIHLERNDIKWPSYSIVFFAGVYSTYWYFLGRFYRKKLPDDKWTLCITIPLIMGIATLNLYYLFYMTVCYAGGKLCVGKRTSGVRLV